MNVLYCSSQKNALTTQNANRFFEDFVPLFSGKKDYTESKAALLIGDLNSKDSAEFYSAWQSFDAAPFSTSDIPLLNEALLKTYLPLTTDFDFNRINIKISYKLEELTDASTITYIKNKYHELKEERLRYVAIATLSGIHTSDSYTALAELLSRSAFKDGPGYKFRNSLKDSLALTASIISVLLQRTNDSAYVPAMASIIKTLIDSGFVKRENVEPYFPNIISNALEVFPGLETNEYYDYEMANQIELISLFKTESANAVIKKYQYAYPNDLKEVAVFCLLRNGQNPDLSIVDTLAKDKNLRIYFYNKLEEIGKDSLFPKKFLTQQSFAESQVFSSSEDDTPSQIEFLEKRTGKLNDKRYVFYLYKVQFGTEKEKSTFLGVGGGYSVSGKGLEEELPLSGIYWEEEYDSARKEELFNIYLDQFKE